MYIVCKSSSGFEDQLTEEKTYQVKQVQNGSYLVTNDKGVSTWYGTVHFEVTLI